MDLGFPIRPVPISAAWSSAVGSISIKSGMSQVSASAAGSFLIGGDLPVHRLGYGTMRLVGEGAWGEPNDPAEARTVLRRAVELGINLIDTADAYGPEIAER